MLKGRLLFVYEKIEKCRTICDVGTDHGYIPIRAILDGKAETAVATDINAGPLEAVKRNAVKAGVLKKMQLRQGDGLFPLKEEADTIVVAGMGGELISRILCENIEKAKCSKSLILQPMNSEEVLRRNLFEEGFDIYEEELIAEGSKIYLVLCARYTGKILEEEEFYCYLGRKLFEKKDPLLVRWMDKKIHAYQKALHGLAHSSKNDFEEKNKKDRLLKRMLEERQKLLEAF